MTFHHTARNPTVHHLHPTTLTLITNLTLTNYTSSTSPPFNSQILVRNAVKLTPRPLRLPLPRNNVHSRNNFSTLYVALTRNRTLTASTKTTNYAVTHTSNTHFPLRIHFRLAKNNFAPHAYRKDAVIAVNAPHAGIYFHGPNIPPSNIFACVKVHISTNSTLTISQVR